jgi:serine/threonine-protein kinase RsbW
MGAGMSSPHIRLALVNRPENVSVIRELLSGVAEALDIAASQLNDIKTAVSEAANNVVLHAYDGAAGPLVLEVLVQTDAVVITVRDAGGGIRPHPVPDDDVIQGIGLAVIQALTQRVEFRGAAESGTEVEMTFALEQELPDRLTRREPAPLEQFTPAGETVISMAPRILFAPVLGRLIGALAVRADFSVDRLADAQLVTDALACAGTDDCGERLTLSVDAQRHRLDLRVSGLEAAGAQTRSFPGSDFAGVGAIVEKLADQVETEHDGNLGDVLHVAFVEHRVLTP